MVNDTTKLKLPKPVTVTGSSFQQPEPEEEIADDESGEIELPEPVAVFGDDEDETQTATDTAPAPADEVKKNDKSLNTDVSNAQAPLDDLLPKIEPASSEPALETPKIAKPVPSLPVESDTVSLPSLPPLAEDEADLPQLQPSVDQANISALPANPVPLSSVIVKSDTVSASNQTPNSVPLQTQPSLDDTDFTLPKLDMNAVPAEISELTGAQPGYAPVISDGNQVPVFTPPPQMPADTQSLNVPTAPSGGASKVLLGLGIFLIGGGLVVGGYFAVTSFMNKSKNNSPAVAYQEPQTTVRPIQTAIPVASQSAAPTSTAKASPKSTAKATANPTPKASTSPKQATAGTIKVQILNGSGKKGDALIAKDLLVAGDYDVTTGNADNFDYVGLSIEYKSANESQAQQIATALEKTYGKATLESTLKDSDDNDVVITLGSSSAKPSATPKPSPTATPAP